MHILLAEDNPTNERIARQLLGKLGHTCETAWNGREALDIMRTGKEFDCIFMDVAMPEMDGIEATTRLLDEFPNVPPIIAVTANAFESDRERCFAAGMSGFLPKPLTLAMLREGLGNLDSVTDGDADAGDFDGEVDFEHFDSIMSAGQEAVEIFDDFCAEVPAQLENLNALSKNGGASEFAAGAHQLKGSFSAFGLASFSIKMGDFEEIGMSGDLSVLEDGWAQETIDHFRSTEASLRARL